MRVGVCGIRWISKHMGVAIAVLEGMDRGTQVFPFQRGISHSVRNMSQIKIARDPSADLCQVLLGGLRGIRHAMFALSIRIDRATVSGGAIPTICVFLPMIEQLEELFLVVAHHAT